jgi:hypothetical protein
LGELSADKLSADKLSADKLSADKLSADKLSADELSAIELPLYRKKGSAFTENRGLFKKQGCQMENFQTQNLGNFRRVLQWKILVPTFYGHLVYFSCM